MISRLSIRKVFGLMAAAAKAMAALALCATAFAADSAGVPAPGPGLAAGGPKEGLLYGYAERYSGSASCAKCHSKVHEAWKNSLHAKALISGPAAAALPELAHVPSGSRGPSVVTSEVVFATGYHWTRRYALRNGNVLPYLYSPGEGRFLDHYDRNYRYTDFEAECIGCHVTGILSIGFSPGGTASVEFAEAGVGCEACHGPSASHAATGDPKKTVNPAKLSRDRRDMICMACHTNGHDKSGRLKYPAGYAPGGDLGEHFTNMVPKPGQMGFGGADAAKYAFTGDNSAADRARQFAYWKKAFMAKNGLSCSDCLDFRSSSSAAAGLRGASSAKKTEYFSGAEYCFTCHGTRKPFDRNNDPAETGVIHAGYLFTPRPAKASPGAPGAAPAQPECSMCHPAASVHDHKYIPKPE